MKRIQLLAAALALSAGTVLADGIQDWNKQDVEGHPSTWWHWMDGNVTKHGITADLEAIHAAGIREAQIFNVGMGYPAGTARYLSPEWLDLVKWAATEAQRLGMTLCMHNGPGWSSSGGSWVKPENSMQQVCWTETKIKGNGKQQRLQLQQPETRKNYYKDIAVLAFPTPASDVRIVEFRLKSLGQFQNPDKMPVSEQAYPAAATVGKGSIINISDKMDADGNLTWEVPEGEWTILRFGHTSTGETSHPVNGITGGGLEIDKLSAKAMDLFWQDGIQPILDHIGPLAGTVLNNLLIDSYETGSANWTEGFEEEFHKRCGYSCMDYFPAMAGYCVNSGQESERFFWDIRKVCSDLMAENYYDHFRDLCHQHGILFSTEPYTGPFDGLRVGAPSDIVMGEFWMGNAGMNTSSKLAASVAHVGGKTLVGAEAFTAGEAFARWNSRHADMKALGDFYWADGINRFIFHTYVHQPTDEAPGYTLGEYGSHFNRLNTLWPQHHYYLDYVNRSQYLLQQGKFVGDILVFVGESTPNNGTFCGEIKAKGYDYDEVWTDMMYQLTVRDHLICTPAGATYRVLMLPETDQMTPRMLQNVKRLVDAGACVVGRRPRFSPSLQDYPECDSQVLDFASELWGQGKIKDISPIEALQQMGVAPDFETSTGNQGVCFIHRTTPEGEVYFVSNQLRQLRNIDLTFRVEGLTPELWDPMTGQTRVLPAYDSADGRTTLRVSFQPDQSFFFVFRTPVNSGQQIVAQDITYKEEPHAAPLPGLEIVKAEWGHFLPLGVIDITEQVARRVKDNQLDMVADNSEWGDPIFGTVKHMQVTYSVDGREPRSICVPENQRFRLPAADEQGKLTIEKVFYGALDASLDEDRPVSPTDVTEMIRQQVADGEYVIKVQESYSQGQTFRKEPALRITYRTEGNILTRQAGVGSEFDLSMHPELTTTTLQDGQIFWTTHSVGSNTITTADGKTLKARVAKVPQPLELNGAWSVSFEGLDAPAPTSFDKLTSLSEHPDESVRHFSGTTIYRQSFTLPKAYTAKNQQLRLELGNVIESAEVFINGQLVGNCWCSPFYLDATDFLHSGKNDIEIRVCNQWANHLIGEEKTGRHDTKATHQHWNKDSELLPAGLLGPVKLRVLKQAAFK